MAIILYYGYVKHCFPKFCIFLNLSHNKTLQMLTAEATFFFVEFFFFSSNVKIQNHVDHRKRLLEDTRTKR